MPWSKFRPTRQFGKHNVRIFKEMLKARNKRNLPIARFHPDVAAFFKEHAIQFHDPLDPNFFKQYENDELEEPLLPQETHSLKQTSTSSSYIDGIKMFHRLPACQADDE